MSKLQGVLLAVLVAACGVKKSVHQKALDENRRLQTELTDTQGKLSETQQKLAATEQTLSEKIKELEGQVTSLDADAKGKEKEIGGLKGQAAATAAELAELRRQKDAAEKRIAAYKALQDKFRALVDTGKLQVVFRNGQMTLKLPSGILFPSGSASLSKDGEKALTDIVGVLMQFKERRFVVAGHTDNQPIRTAEFKNNWYLSTARANSVVQHMIKEKFPAKSLAAAGYGEFDPVAPNDAEPGREQNRRIEIILVPNLEELPSLTGAAP
ncbi:MAG: OmpA family protein [Deltaproteobacteria bacterium]|nr:OmpA family protein [Deltaproteobacteria bacterium]MCW5803588.1 OmpA family protein [Deltaproteobacteria bacterium]